MLGVTKNEDGLFHRKFIFKYVTLQQEWAQCKLFTFFIVNLSMILNFEKFRFDHSRKIVSLIPYSVIFKISNIYKLNQVFYAIKANYRAINRILRIISAPFKCLVQRLFKIFSVNYITIQLNRNEEFNNYKNLTAPAGCGYGCK